MAFRLCGVVGDRRSGLAPHSDGRVDEANLRMVQQQGRHLSHGRHEFPKALEEGREQTHKIIVPFVCCCFVFFKEMHVVSFTSKVWFHSWDLFRKLIVAFFLRQLYLHPSQTLSWLYEIVQRQPHIPPLVDKGPYIQTALEHSGQSPEWSGRQSGTWATSKKGRGRGGIAGSRASHGPSQFSDGREQQGIGPMRRRQVKFEATHAGDVQEKSKEQAQAIRV